MLDNEAMNEQENVPNINYNELISDCVGFDEDDNPKSGFSVETGMYESATDTLKITGNISYFNPQLNIMRTGETMIVDFIFANKTDSEMRAIWSLLNKYGREFEKAVQESSKTIPIFRFTIVPTKYAGRYAVVCMSPMYWALQPETPTSDINTIRTVFPIDAVAFTESEGFDLADIEADIQREEMEREYIEEAMDRRREEQEEYQNERNERMEELRRDKQNW